jgi:hypothetical protein
LDKEKQLVLVGLACPKTSCINDPRDYHQGNKKYQFKIEKSNNKHCASFLVFSI